MKKLSRVPTRLMSINKNICRIATTLLYQDQPHCISYVATQLVVRQEARWCVLNAEELTKCHRLVAAINERARLSDEYPFQAKPYDELPQVECIQGMGHFDCMQRISDYTADLIQLDSGLGYTAGEFFTMVPLMAERYTEDANTGLDFYAVAVVRKDKPDITFDTLHDRKACHPSVGHAAGWVHPISTLIEDDIMPIEECNVPVKSATSFFGDMCAPNGLERFYNPFGNNPVTICENCQGDPAEYCTSMDPFAGYGGAFECMASKTGDVAFVRHFTLDVMLQNSTQYNRNQFELLCRDGQRASIDQYQSCNLGTVSSHIVMASAATGEEIRNLYKELLHQIDLDFGYNGEFNHIFELYNSDGYGGRRNVLFSDMTKELVDVSTVTDSKGNPRDTYYSWVGDDYRRRLRMLNRCPISQARWCVISEHEMTKCENMIMAFAAKGLKPDLNCIRGRDVKECMDMIRQGDVDLVALDSADVFVAGKYYGLVPIAAEDYSGYVSRTYYSVAVARRTDSYLTVFNLKGRRSCHSSVMSASGWISPVDKLIETGQIHITGCNVYRHVGEFFSKSCVPGVLNKSYNSKGSNPINLCEACSAGGPERCQRNDDELYYGNSGAFRCLTEMGGDIAFMKHTTVRENTDGRNQAEWARNRRSDDYQLLCNDGRRADIDDWKDCNMGKVPANAIVTADFKTQKERDIYWTLLNYAQQFFSADSNEDFQMFQSTENPDHKDLIFQDSTVRLVPVAEDLQNYEDYLEEEFTRSMERMEGIDCITANTAPTIGSTSGITRYMSLLLCIVTVFYLCL